MSDTDITTTSGLFSLLGSFWTEVYTGNAQAESLCAAVSEVAKQLKVDTDQAARVVSFQDTVLYRRERWFPIQLRSNELNTTPGNIPRFGDGYVFGRQPDGSTLQYGQAVPRYYSFPAPANLKSFQTLASRITSPGLVFINGVEVLHDAARGLLLFASNPLTSPLVGVQSVDTENGLVDTAVLWMSDALFEHSDVYRQHGYVFGLDEQHDSETQHAGLMAVSNAVVGGSSQQTFGELLVAGTGIPQAASDQVVEYILADSRGRAIVTDKCVYRVPADSTISWEPGDTIPAGSFVTDDVSITDFRRGLVPESLAALVVSKDMLAAGILGDLVFPNKLVPLVSTYTTGGEVTTFELGGSPTVVREFFRIFSERLRAEGLRLSALTNASGEPPGQINPLRFLVKNWLRNSLLVVKLAGPALKGIGASHLLKLRELTPPHTLLILMIDLHPAPVQLTLGSSPRVGKFTGTATQQASCPVGTIRVKLRSVNSSGVL
jgi:hypothetical protein